MAKRKDEYSATSEEYYSEDKINSIEYENEKKPSTAPSTTTKNMLSTINSIQSLQSETTTATTPTSNKKRNRFRFQTFSEKIASIDINIFGKVGDMVIELDDEQNDSYFHQTMMAWRELDLTEDFERFQRNLRRCPIGLAELLLDKERIVNILTDHIKRPNNKSLKPLLSLLAALSRDLRSEFFPYFYGKILPTLISLLVVPQQPDTIEQLFTSICFQFKFLEKQITKDFIICFKLYTDLFKQRRKYIRRFAAESMAYLLRKISFENLQSTLNEMFEISVEKNRESVGGEYFDAFSYLLFHMVKGTKGRFHSRTEYTIPMFFRSIDYLYTQQQEDEDKMDEDKEEKEELNLDGINFGQNILLQVYQFILQHAKNENDNLDSIWKILLSESDFLSKQLQKVTNYNKYFSTQLNTFYTIIQSFISYKRGTNIKDYKDVLDIIGKILNKQTYKNVIVKYSYDVASITVAMSSLLPQLHFGRFKDHKETFSSLVEILFTHSDQTSQTNIFAFCLSIDRHHLFESFVLQRLLKFVERNIDQLDFEQTVTFLVRLIALDSNGIDGMTAVSDYPILHNTPKLAAKLQTYLQKTATSAEVDRLVWACLVLSLSLEFTDKSIIKVLESCFQNICKHSPAKTSTTSKSTNKSSTTTTPAPTKDEDQTITYLQGQCLIARVVITSRVDANQLYSLLPLVLELVESHPENFYILNATSIYLDTLIQNHQLSQFDSNNDNSSTSNSGKGSFISISQSSQQQQPQKQKKSLKTKQSPQQIKHLVSYEQFEKLLPLFSKNLSSKSSSIRKSSVMVMLNLHKATLSTSEKDGDIARLLEYFLEIETTEFHKIEGRAVVSKMDSCLTLFTTGKAGILNQHFFNYLLGAFYIRYTPLWASVQKAILQVCKSSDHIKSFYPLFYQRLQDSNEEVLDHTRKSRESKLLQQQEIEEVEEEKINEAEDEEEAEEDKAEEEEVYEEEEEEEVDQHEMTTHQFDLSILKVDIIFQEILELSKGTFQEHLGVKNIIKSATHFTAYNEVLWKTLSQLGHLVEQYSKDIVIEFIDFITIDFHRFSSVFTRQFPAHALIGKGKDAMVVDSAQQREQRGYTKPQAIIILTFFLEFFGQMKKPLQLYRTSLLQEIFLRTLEVDESTVQMAGLQCVLLTRQLLHPYRKNFERLIGEKTMRDEMVNFVISKSSPTCSVPLDHRAEIIDIVSKIVMSKLNKKTSGRIKIDAQRSTIFAYLSGLDKEEIQPIFERITSSFTKAIAALPQVDQAGKKGCFKSIDDFNKSLDLLPQFDAQVQFLNILLPFTKQMGMLLVDKIQMIVRVLLSITINACQELGNSSSKSSEIRSLSMRRIAHIVQQFEQVDFNPHLTVLFQVVSKMLPHINAYGVPIGIKQLILTISTQEQLVHHLTTDATLLPKLFSFITHGPIQGDIMTLIENILVKADESDVYKNILIPHVDTVISAVKSVLYRGARTRTNMDGQIVKPTMGSLSRRQLMILAELSRYAKNPEQASQLLDLLVPFFKSGSSLLKKIRSDKDMVVSLLTIFKNMIEFVENPESHIQPLSALFASFTTKASREILCEVFQSIGTKVPSIKSIVPMLNDLNAFSTKTIADTYDFEPRLKAFAKLNEQLDKFDSLQLPSILNNYVFYLLDKDFSIRACASSGMTKFFQQLTSLSATEKEWRYKLIYEVFVPQVRANLQEPGDARVELINLFNLLVQKHSEFFFPDMKVLVGDKSFFASFTHIQVSKRRSAFTTLREIIKSKTNEFKVSTIVQYLIPICLATIQETNKKESSYLGEICKAIGELAALLEWRAYYQVIRTIHHAMAKHPIKQKFLLRALCDVLDNFHFFLDKQEISSEMIESIKKKKATIKVVKIDDKKKNKQEDDEVEITNDDEENDDIFKSDALDLAKTMMVVDIKEKVKVRNISEEIHQAIVHVLVPELEKFLIVTKKKHGQTLERETIIDVSVSLAMFKLYSLLPDESSKVLYPPLIGKVANELKAKNLVTRESARETLVKLLEMLGIRFFPFILHDLKFVLKSGYMKHILVFTLHAMLLQLQRNRTAPGLIDSQAKLVMEIIIDYLFLDVSIPKDSIIQDSYMEAKQPRVMDALKILTTLTHFDNINKHIIKPIEDLVQDSTSPSFLNNVSKMLRKIAKGISLNTSVTNKSSLIFIYQQFQKGEKKVDVTKLEKEELKKKEGFKPTYEDTFSIQADPNKKKAEMIKRVQSNQYIYTDFALILMFNLLTHKEDVNSLEYLQMVDPMIPNLIKSLEHKNSKIVALSIRCFNQILNYELPTLKAKINSVMVLILKRLQMDQADEELTTFCYEIIIQILKDPANTLVNEQQLRGILSLTKQLFTETEIKVTKAIKLLHVLIKRKVLLAEIYDLVDLSGNMLVRSHTLLIQNQLTDLMIDFLIFYPMGEKRLKQQMTFFVKNLNYESEDGRMAVLKMLLKVTKKFPQQVLNSYSQIIFVPLIVRIANDQSSKCRNLASTVLQSLLKMVSNQIANKLIELTIVWFGNSDNIPMAKTASQVFGIASEVVEGFNSYFEKIVPLAVKHLQKNLEILRQLEQSSQIFEEIGGDDESVKTSASLTGWQLSYNIFCMAERIQNNYPALIASKLWVPFWQKATEYFNYPHIWVRTSVSRLFGGFFTNQKLDQVIPLISKINNPKSKVEQNVHSYIFNSTNLFTITKKTCSTLNSRLLSDDLGNQVVKNLVYLSIIFFKCQTVRPAKSEDDDDVENEVDDVSSVAKPVVEENPNNMSWGFDDVENEQSSSSTTATPSEDTNMNEVENDEEEDNESSAVITSTSNGEEYPMLLWLFKRLSYMSTKIGYMRRKYIFRWMAAMVSQLPLEKLIPYLELVMLPLYKTSTGGSHKSDEEDMKDLAEEVLRIIKKKVGGPTFSLSYKQVESNVQQQRSDRKQQKKIDAVANPKEYQINKAQQRKKAQLTKKRKNAEYADLVDDRINIKVPRHFLEDI